MSAPGAIQTTSPEPGAFELSVLIPAGTTNTFIVGNAITAAGAKRVIIASADSAEAAGDVYIHGTRHSSDGLMYVTLDTPPGSNDQYINGLLHSGTGVRYVQTGDTTIKWPEGQAANSSGVLAYMIDELTIVGYVHGHGVDVDGGVFLNT